MSYLFTPPGRVERPDTGNRLIDCWVKIARGVTVLKNQDGSYTSVGFPTQDQVAAAKAVYLGGHVTPVSDTEAVALSSAGFSAYLSFTNTYIDSYSVGYF